MCVQELKRTMKESAPADLVATLKGEFDSTDYSLDTNISKRLEHMNKGKQTHECIDDALVIDYRSPLHVSLVCRCEQDR